MLPEDLEAVEAYAGRPAVAGDPEQYGLHTELLPTPFNGDATIAVAPAQRAGPRGLPKPDRMC